MSENDDWQQKAWAAYAALPSAKAEIQALLDKLTEDIRQATGQDSIEVYLDITPLDIYAESPGHNDDKNDIGVII